ncbi:hypothetical protein JTE90_007466 [Oedothorax gibbosus]|uniref:Zinc finger CW-type PWWP domain protein 1 n=1 Tax=Oedothorax gibbosus TaxID=931172 RepID=A0AAV6UB98_9ARAC|nr:hypothetical protein JTE90_007466 [Oedothorax gibbosus]
MRTKQAKRFKISTKDRHLAWIDHYTSKDFGIWIECTSCKKWRKNLEYSESHEVPEHWCCSMATCNGKKGNCEDPEENSEEEFYEYCPGSLVWARLDGYPWWPGMVDEDPDIEEYFFEDDKGIRSYNITFLDERVTHAWIPANSLSSFLNPPPRNSCVQKQYRKNKYSDAIMKAEKRAQIALKMTIKERLKKFSFANLFKGKWPVAEGFESNDEDDDVQDVIDQLIQEVDDLSSINSLDTDDSESTEADKRLDFLPSEKKFLKRGFDYLKKNTKTKNANVKKQSFKTMKDPKTAKRNLVTGITKLEKNLFMESFQNETNHLKTNKTSQISTKKPNIKNSFSKIGIANLKQNTTEEIELKDISDHNSSGKSAAPVTSSPLNNKPLDETDDEEDGTVDFEVNCVQENYVKSKEINNSESPNSVKFSSPKSCDVISEARNKENSLPENVAETTSEDNSMLHIQSDIAVKKTASDKNPIAQTGGEMTSEENSLSHHTPESSTEDNSLLHTETNTHKEQVFQNTEDPNSNIIVIEKSNEILESLGMDKLSQLENVTILRHLNECIDDVINYAGDEMELSSKPVQQTAKTSKKNSSVTKSIGKTPVKKLVSNETVKKIKKNIDTQKNISKENGRNLSTVKSTPQKSVKALSPSTDNPEEIGNLENSTVLKKPAQLVGFEKAPKSKKLKGIFPKECQNTNKVTEVALKEKVTKNNLTSKGQNNNLDTGDKIKPDFKSFKRPFKNNSSLKNPLANKKQCTEQTLTGKSGIEKYSFVELLDNTLKSNVTPLEDSKDEAKASVLEYKEEDIAIETKTHFDSSYPDSKKFTSENKENDIETIVIQEDENIVLNRDVMSKDDEEMDDCFFCVDISDEE